MKTTTSMIRPDETRLIVGGLETPPYEDAVAYVRSAEGEHGIRYSDGYTDWLGSAGKAFGDETVEAHPATTTERPMETTTRTTLSDEAREILDELGISVISDDPSGRFPAPGGYVALGDEGSGAYEGRFLIDAVEAACEAVADPSKFVGDEDRTASDYRFEAFHDALDEAHTR